MSRISLWVDWTRRIFLAVASVSLFIFALMLVKNGAAPMAPFIRNKLSVDSPASALGFGWLGAMLALSGSPIAAAALSLQEAGVLSVEETYGMIAGTRLGASFIVLLIGLIYMRRGKSRHLSLGVGLLSLLVTQTTYILVIPLGAGLLTLFSRGGNNAQASIKGIEKTSSVINMLLDPVINIISTYLPEGIILIVGMVCIVFSLRLFDKVIPELDLQRTQLSLLHRLLFRPWVAILIGMAITTLTMSVSVSLALLVPLSVRGYIRRENAIPYVMGANITTFIDTLAAASLIGSAGGLLAVGSQMLATFITALLILLFFRHYERFIERLLELTGENKFTLGVYISLIFLVPFLLIWLG